MGLIHSRASKRRDKAEAKLLEQQLKDQRRAAAEERAGDSALRQPTLGGALRKAAENRRRGPGGE